MNAVNPIKPVQSNTHQSIENIHNQLNNLHNIVENLESRLHFVLQDQNVQGSGSPSTQPSSPLTRSLLDASEKIDSIGSLVSDILSRLDI